MRSPGLQATRRQPRYCFRTSPIQICLVFTITFTSMDALTSLWYYIAGDALEDYLEHSHPASPDSPKSGGAISTYNTGNGVLAAAWSPNGIRLAMENWNGQVQAFDANTGLDIINFHAPDLHQQVETFIWLPDGHSIAA